MALKRGNTYSLDMPVKFNGVLLKDTDVSKVVFKIGDIQKEYPSDDVTYDTDHFVVKLTQEDTLKLDGIIMYEVAVKLRNGQVKRSTPKNIYSIDTIINEVI